ncbi:LOW QUALITY PROTEIN: hypothetical protein HID58_047784 [Brassica napus]|uniref:Uncharacterized protein n=1 Tax=Brassica napus TaxID=3708 RepID=A0ABQ8B078_BRANA|nr:LOW QUALITY PROTEIN: hypothetical protein HID58_047784 [Brassica napus]
MESGEIVGIGDYHVETKREKRWSLLSQLLADPILGDVPRNPTLSDVVTLVSLETGSAMRLSIVKLDGSSLDVAVMNSATLKDLKIFDQEENGGSKHGSSPHFLVKLSPFLSFRKREAFVITRVLFVGVRNKSQVHPYRICSICDEAGSGKTLEEEEASSLSFTPQDLLDSSRRFPVIKVLVICNGEKMWLPLGLLTMEVLEEPLFYFDHSVMMALRAVSSTMVCVMLIVLWKVEEVRPLNQVTAMMIGGTQARLHHRRKLCPLEKGTD